VTRNNLITDENHSKSYVQKALVPMLSAIKDHKNVIIETINEPEWCMKGIGGSGISDQNLVAPTDMQRFVSMIAEVWVLSYGYPVWCTTHPNNNPNLRPHMLLAARSPQAQPP